MTPLGLKAVLTDEQIECRSIKCDDFALYRQLWAAEVKSWERNSEYRPPVEMAIIALRNDALYSPWYGSAHHMIHAAADVLLAEIKRLRNASADTHPKDGDSTQIEAPLVSGAVPLAADAQTTPPSSNEGKLS